MNVHSERVQIQSWATRLPDEFPLISQSIDEAECVSCRCESLIGAKKFRSMDWHEHPIRDLAQSTDNFHHRVKGTLTSGLLNRPSPKCKSNILGALTTKMNNCLDRCDSPRLMSFVNSLAGANDSTHVNFIIDHRIVKCSQQDAPTCDAVIQAHSGAHSVVQNHKLNRHSLVFNVHCQSPCNPLPEIYHQNGGGNVRHG